MIDNIPSFVQQIMELMHNSMFSPYLVGGCVRDHVMNIIPHDYDITVCAFPNEIISLFEKNGYKASQKGKQYGTVEVCIGEESAEITPYRLEGSYTDARHPGSVSFVKDIRLDLVRRDFTINAMAMDKDGNIIDLFGGRDDINSKTIRCVGDPHTRFSEDALRILRAIRFASRLSFSIESNTLKAMKSNAELLCSIPVERQIDELRGTIIYPGAYEILDSCQNLIEVMIPGFQVNNFLKADTGDFSLKLFSCVYDRSHDELCTLCKKLKLSKSEYDKIITMHILYNKFLTRCGEKIIFDDKTKLALCEYPCEYIHDLYVFSNSNITELENFSDNGVYTVSRLAISGGDIADSCLFPKNMTSKILNFILRNVATGKIRNEKKDILDYLSSISVDTLE